MKPIDKVEGTMVPLARPDVDTDQIIPKQFLKRIERTGYGEFLFYDWARDGNGDLRDDFVLNEPARTEARVLVTGPNFGCGSSREHAVWAIQDYGFEAVIAPSFADIFRNNSMNSGLLTIELEPLEVEQLLGLAARSPEASVAIDLDSGTVAAGEETYHFSMEPEAKRRLLLGLDSIGETLQWDEQIASHETLRPGWMPRTGELAG